MPIGIMPTFSAWSAHDPDLRSVSPSNGAATTALPLTTLDDVRATSARFLRGSDWFLPCSVDCITNMYTSGQITLLGMPNRLQRTTEAIGVEIEQSLGTYLMWYLCNKLVLVLATAFSRHYFLLVRTQTQHLVSLHTYNLPADCHLDRKLCQ